MAIAGGMCTAYRLRLAGAVIVTERTTWPRHECVEPEEAAEQIRAGKTVVVAGVDAPRVRQLVTGKDIYGGTV